MEPPESESNDGYRPRGAYESTNERVFLQKYAYFGAYIFMIVTIDGPAGAGKSRVARELAIRLGHYFLDTGAMYRAVTLKAARLGIDWENTAALAQTAREMDLRLQDDRVILDGEDVTDAIRSFEITTNTRYAADNQEVRKKLVELQRQIGANQDLVTEGRDQATVVFPDAECKIFLTASDEIRAERRLQDLLGRGEQVTFDEVLEKQTERDRRDRERVFGGLKKAADSIEVDTDNLTPEEVVSELERIVRARQSR